MMMMWEASDTAATDSEGGWLGNADDDTDIDAEGDDTLFVVVSLLLSF